MVTATGLVSEGGARPVDLVRSVLPSTVVMREPREGEVAVLPRLGLVEDDALTLLDELLRVVIPAGEGDLGEQKAGLEIPPWVLEPLEDLRSDRRVRAAGGEVVRVDRDEREEPLARGLAAWVHQLAERGAGRERTGTRRVHLAGAVVGMAEDDIALGNAEPVTDRVERLPRVDEEIPRATKAAYGGLDHREEDEALRAAEHVTDGIAALRGLE